MLTEKIFKEPNEPLPSTTTVASSGTPSFVAQPVTFTAIVTSSYGAIPDGELVTFFDDPDHTVKTEIGTGTTTGGVATCTTLRLWRRRDPRHHCHLCRGYQLSHQHRDPRRR